MKNNGSYVTYPGGTNVPVRDPRNITNFVDAPVAVATANVTYVDVPLPRPRPANSFSVHPF